MVKNRKKTIELYVRSLYFHLFYIAKLNLPIFKNKYNGIYISKFIKHYDKSFNYIKLMNYKSQKALYRLAIENDYNIGLSIHYPIAVILRAVILTKIYNKRFYGSLMVFLKSFDLTNTDFTNTEFTVANTIISYLLKNMDTNSLILTLNNVSLNIQGKIIKILLKRKPLTYLQDMNLKEILLQRDLDQRFIIQLSYLIGDDDEFFINFIEENQDTEHTLIIINRLIGTLYSVPFNIDKHMLVKKVFIQGLNIIGDKRSFQKLFNTLIEYYSELTFINLYDMNYLIDLYPYFEDLSLHSLRTFYKLLSIDQLKSLLMRDTDDARSGSIMYAITKKTS